MTTAPPRPLAYPGESVVLAKRCRPAQHLLSVAEDWKLGGGELLDIAEGLRRSALLWPGMSRPRRRVWALMAATENFEAWAIAWPTGGLIELHDHGSSAGAVAVASGELRETTVIEDGTGVGSCLTRVVTAGESLSFGPNYVHGFVNIEPLPAISVHVYSPRLTRMTYFDFVDGRLEPDRVLRYQAELPVP